MKPRCQRLLDRASLRLAAAVAIATLALVPALVNAHADFASKPVRILVGFVPGGFTDTAARIIGQSLAAALGQQVIDENRPGANGLIAAGLAAKSQPDGYTLLMSSAGLTTNPLLYDKLQRDPVKDFSAIAPIGGIPNLLVVHPAIPARTTRELLALARARPASLTQYPRD